MFLLSKTERKNNIMEKEKLTELAEKALEGDRKALEAIVEDIQAPVFNMALRMLGTFADAEDAAQEILLKIITNMSSFRKESAFSTWVFSIAANHLKNYKKHMFAHVPLSFEYYGDDISNGKIHDVPDLTQNVEKNILAEELKMSCTNVMLQCLDAESRCIFVLGTMFRTDSRIAGEILGITPEAYRQRLSRVRRKMADFLGEYCGEYGKGECRCADRINYAIKSHRLDPSHTDYTSAKEISPETMLDVKEAMEEIDGLAQSFTFIKMYEAPERISQYVKDFLSSDSMAAVKKS